MALKSAKQILRKDIKRRLAVLSESEKHRQSQIVTYKLLERKEFQESRRVSVFLSMSDEIQTHNILQYMLEKGYECFIPRYQGPNMDMVKLYSMQDYEAFPETSWKIKQPKDDDERPEALATGGLDLILMPGLGFTKEGARLGRGKGYYDTYLERCEKVLGKVPCTIALAYHEQICDSIPVSDHDRNVDVVLFEDEKND